MNRFRPGWEWLVTFAVAALVSSSTAQNAINPASAPRPRPLPLAIMPPPPLPSPMDYFRNLLAMSPDIREKILAGKPPEIRAKMLAKVNEYAALDPDERELRLRATELRWYLVPLLRATPEDRATRLAQVPDNIRAVLQSRLMQWEILPPPLQREFLENEHILSYFSSMNTTNHFAMEPAPSGAEQSHWNALSDDEHKMMTAQFNAFFELSPAEKQKALGRLSGVERAQMQKAIQTFGQLPPEQRIQCMQALGKFARMNPEERAAFLKNAQRWAQMSPAERKAWVDLVMHVPQWPPAPPAMLIPPPRSPRPVLSPIEVTNRS